MEKLGSDLKLIRCKQSKVESIFHENKSGFKYPYIVSKIKGKINCYLSSPLHGRSIIVDFNQKTNRFIVTKGNGLTYFPYGFVSTGELENNAWGFLSLDDGVRDYKSCKYVNGLGIKTNIMEAIYSLSSEKLIFDNKIEYVKPNILQYSVECPYRIADIPFLRKKTINQYVTKWSKTFNSNHNKLHCIATDVLLKNIKTMHDNKILHNAIHSQNYTLSLELLDFELSRTPITPYELVADEAVYLGLQKRELIQSLEIVNQLCYFLKEKIDIKEINKIMGKYGYEGYLS